MFGTKVKKRMIELEAKKEQLEKENAVLKERIAETREYTAWYDETWKNSFDSIGYADRRGGSYGAIKNLPDFEKWEQTSFWKYRKELNRKGNTLKNRECADKWYREFSLLCQKNERRLLLCAYCDMVLPTSNGPIIHVMDPYGEYTFPPSKSISNSEANSMVGFIINFTCLSKVWQKDYEIIDYKKMPYTLYEKKEASVM